MYCVCGAMYLHESCKQLHKCTEKPVGPYAQWLETNNGTVEDMLQSICGAERAKAAAKVAGGPKPGGTAMVSFDHGPYLKTELLTKSDPLHPNDKV